MIFALNFALKMNNNDYYPLCNDYLDILNEEDNLTSLKGIDDFTAKYKEDEIKASIIRSNILPKDIINNSELVIIYKNNEKIRELPIYTLDNLDYLEFEPLKFLLKNLFNKNVINQVQNHFNSKNYIPQDLQQFVISLTRNSVVYIIVTYQDLIYLSKRMLKDYVFNEVLKKMDNKKLERKNETKI